MKKYTSEEFCHNIGLYIRMKEIKGFIGVLLSLSSEVGIKSPTGLSSSEFFQYHYSLLGKICADLSVALSSHYKGMRQIGLEQYGTTREEYSIVSDFVAMHKPHSPSLPSRTYTYKPNNKIAGNKSLEVGYYYSFHNLGTTEGMLGSRWCVPLSAERLEVDTDKVVYAQQQLSGLLKDATLPFQKAGLVVNKVDSEYSCPKYIEPLIGLYSNLLIISKLRHGIKVYRQYQGEQKGYGREKIYDDTPLYLQQEETLKCFNPRTKESFMKDVTPIFSVPADEQITTQGQLSNGRAVLFQMHRWNNMLIEGERGHYMGDKPFDLVSVLVIDALTSELVFDQEMFVAAWGEKRGERSTDQIRQDYRSRYDIEPNNRFNKQQLLMDKYQTPIVEHLDAWVFTVCCANWLLFSASDEVELVVNKWEKYLPEIKKAAVSKQAKTIAQTRKAAKALFRTFDLTPFAPRKSKNGKGRAKGQTQVKRKRFKVIFKTKKTEKAFAKTG